LSLEEKMEVDARSIYVGNVSCNLIVWYKSSDMTSTDPFRWTILPLLTIWSVISMAVAP
jgi:hypothetical protein